jgi:hypothetical protein
MVMFIRADEQGPIATAGHSDDPEVSELAVAALEKRVRAWVADSSNSIGYEAVTVAPGWQLLIAEASTPSGERAGAVAVARRNRPTTSWSAAELSIIRKFAVLCGAFIANRGTEPPATSQWRLDDLVTRVAVELMPVTAASLNEALERTLRALIDFFEVDASYLRRNDFPTRSGKFLSKSTQFSVPPAI